ncbi:MAG: RluA family pseudouridine synthase [Rickettsiales bacterium]|nr:RluA family pseudouridine synthase [Rickettsiales bacterium]
MVHTVTERMNKEHTITADDDAIRLDRWFKRHYPGLPHALLEKQLRKGAIRVDGKKAKSSDRIHEGQVIACPDIAQDTTPKPRSAINPGDAAEVRKWILYQDERIIVVNKPAGLATQGGSKIVKSLDSMVAGLSDEQGRPKLTHRLDRDTSGCVVLARNAKVASQLMSLFSHRKIEKTYLALVNNVPQPLQGSINLPILKKENPKAAGVAGGPQGRDYEIMMIDDEGQKSVSDYRVIDALARKFALVELKPHTGRMHQLRVHMQAIDCSIVGDHKYGGGGSAAISMGVEDRLHLHAWKIALPAFAGGKAVTVKAPLPHHMQQSFKALGLDIPK